MTNSHHTTHRSHKQRWIGLFQEHLVAFVVAIFVLLAVTGVVFYRDTLFADITKSQSNITAAQYASPLVYSLVDGTLQVMATKEFSNATSLTFFVVFDPKKVLLKLESATSPYEYTYAPGLETMVQVTVFPKWTVAENTVLYSVPLNGSISDITLANAGILWENSVFETLSIQQK